MEKTDNYIVYEVRLDGKPIYIGSGKKGREAHALSGASHNAELNKTFFTSGDRMEVIILRDSLDKAESLEREKEFIQALDPICNKVHVLKRVRSKRANKT